MLRSMCQSCAMEFLGADRTRPRNPCNYLKRNGLPDNAQKPVMAHENAP